MRRIAVNFENPPVRAHDLIREWQLQRRSRNLRMFGTARPYKRFEDVGQFFGRYARSGVGNAQLNARRSVLSQPMVTSSLEPYRSACVGGGHGIRQHAG